DRFFNHRLRSSNPLLVVAAFIVLVLNVFGHLTRPWCNVTLGLLKLLLTAAFSSVKDDTLDHEKALLETFPKDVRTVRKLFDLEAKTLVYATCPRCSATYKPEQKGRVLEYP
ncbi:hypothetical protein BJ138DRAFT_978118, partial [Hygrophoropsis aurantiaca]